MPHYRDISDEAFASQCELAAFRGPGPGGQKRNKTSSAVRLTHVPTGLSATGSEHRSQSLNRSAALGRLRLRVVMERRVPLDPEQFAAPEWWSSVQHLRISPRHELYLPAVGLVLDVLAACGWSLSASARLLGLSSAALSGFLRDNPRVWGHVNQQRQRAGLKPLLG